MTNQSAPLSDDFKADRLPVLPHVLLQIIRACHNPELNFQQIAEAVSLDATVAGRVVAAARAAIYGRGARIVSIEEALRTLGTDTLRTIVITLSVQQVFNRFASTPPEFLEDFWRRSLASALFAKSVATLTSYPQPEEAYLAGLFHNVGELVLGVQFGERYFNLRSGCRHSHEQIALERKEFGADHMTAGAWLAGQWRLDAYLIDALRYHHLPTEQVLDAQHLTKLVHLASLLSMTEEPQTEELLAADQLFGLMPPLVREICKRIEGEVEALAEDLQIYVENSSQTKSREVAEELHMISLLQTARSHFTTTDPNLDTLDRIRQAAEILFQTPHSLFFQAESSGRSVVCHPLPQDPGFELRIALQPDRSLITDALLKHKISSWWPGQEQDQEQEQEPRQVIDRQVLAILHTQGLACLPIQQNGNTRGVLVLGLNQPVGETQHRLMMLFGTEAAKTCTARKDVRPAAGASISPEDGLQQTIRETVHEANNPLSIIRNYLEVLARKLDHEHEAQQDLEVIREEVDRTANILLNLSQSSQQRPPDGTTDINELSKQMVQLFRSSIFSTRSIHCELDCDDSIPAIETDEAALRQVLTNLMKNAAEALEPGGVIELSTRDLINFNGKTFIEIRVRDNGPGLAPEVLEHLYQPGHSTKGEGHAGLGLSIVRNLMTGLDGSVSCRSTGQGTEFQLLIPRTLTLQRTKEQTNQ